MTQTLKKTEKVVIIGAGQSTLLVRGTGEVLILGDRYLWHVHSVVDARGWWLRGHHP
jgi:hypothetical protein